MKSSLMRFLFVALFGCVCLLSQTKTASAQHTFTVTIKDAGTDSGTFAGESICLPIEPNCRTERDVFVFELIGQDGGELVVTWDLVQGGMRVSFAKGRVQYDARTNYFNGKLLTARDLVREQEGARSVVATDLSVYDRGGARSGGAADTTDQDFSLIIYNANSASGSATGSTVMEGAVLHNNTIVRRIRLRRVEPNEVPPAPMN